MRRWACRRDCTTAGLDRGGGAALRDGDDPAWDRALAQAVERVLAARDDGERPGLPAMRLAAAIDARSGELPDLLLESLSDRQLGLFVALLTHALGIEHDMVREIVLEPKATGFGSPCGRWTRIGR